MDKSKRDFMLWYIMCSDGSNSDRELCGTFKYLDVVELKRERLIDLVYPAWAAHDGRPIMRLTTLGWEYCQQQPHFSADVSPYAEGRMKPVPVIRHSTNRI